jgi:hypothetical protein
MAQPKLNVVSRNAVKIDMDVPIPADGHSGLPGIITQSLRALADAPIGASVFIVGKKPHRLGPYIASAGSGFGWYAARSVEGGVRVWKIAEPKKRPA